MQNLANLVSLSHHSTIVVDTNDYTPPEKPIIRRLTNQSDTGVSSSDLITSNRKPTFTGNAEPGGTVELLFDNQVIAVGQANQKGLWSLTPLKHEFNDGDHQIYARVTDASGTNQFYQTHSRSPSMKIPIEDLLLLSRILALKPNLPPVCCSASRM